MASHTYLTIASSLCVAIIAMAFVTVYDLYQEINALEQEVMDGMVEFRIVINDAWKDIHSNNKNATPNIFSSFQRNKRALRRCKCCDYSGKFCPKGKTGEDGEPGNNGHDGRPGTPGFRGSDGMRLRCPVHHECTQCPMGRTGPPGAPGKRGRTGFDGHPGKDGNPGRGGSRGPPGLMGDQGEPGKPGHPGHPGHPGLDGHRITVRRGPKGAPGIEGFPGHKGPDGKVGPPGHRGIQGLPGRRGEAGRAGKDGKDGIDGKPGKNGEDEGFCPCPKSKRAQSTNATISSEEKSNEKNDTKLVKVTIKSAEVIEKAAEKKLGSEKKLENLQSLPKVIIDEVEKKEEEEEKHKNLKGKKENPKGKEKIEGDFVQ